MRPARMLLLLAALAPLSCAWGRSRPKPPPPPLSDPFAAPVSSAVIQKARACQKVEDCGAPPADGTTWQCRLGACTPTAAVPEEPAATDERQAAAAPIEPLPDAEPPKGDPAGDRSTVPPGLFAPSPGPAPITPPAVEVPPPAPPPVAPPPPPPTPAPPAPAPPPANPATGPR